MMAIASLPTPTTTTKTPPPHAVVIVRESQPQRQKKRVRFSPCTTTKSTRPTKKARRLHESMSTTTTSTTTTWINPAEQCAIRLDNNRTAQEQLCTTKGQVYAAGYQLLYNHVVNNHHHNNHHHNNNNNAHVACECLLHGSDKMRGLEDRAVPCVAWERRTRRREQIRTVLHVQNRLLLNNNNHNKSVEGIDEVLRNISIRLTEPANRIALALAWTDKQAVILENNNNNKPSCHHDPPTDVAYPTGRIDF